MARPKGSKTKTWPLIRYRPSTPFRPWMVDCGMMEGKRVRFAFATKEQAEGKASLMRIQRRDEGDTSFSISSKFDRVDAESALDLLKPHNVTLLSAAEFYVRNIAIIQNQKPVTEVVDELLKLKTQHGRSARYLKDLRLKLKGAFCDSGGFGARAIHEVSARELDDWLRASVGWSALTRNNYATALGVLFSFALKRGYVLKNPALELETATVKLSQPGILSTAQAEALLANAPKDFVPAIAIGFFAGLRPEAELWNLDWKAVDLGERLIDVTVSKNSASHRFVKISDNLAKWLKPYAGLSGPACPRGDAYHSRLQKARLAAAQELEKAKIPADELRDWPQDGMRHTFASMHYAHFKHAAETAEQMGHAGGLRVFFRHYRNRVKPLEARAFWQLVSSGKPRL
jgi:integrase